MPEGLFRPTSPAWNSALGLGFDSAGVAGIAFVGALGMLAFFTVVVLLARRLGARPLPMLAAATAVALLALPMISPRATVVIEALLLATIALGHWALHASLPHTPWTIAGFALTAAALSWVGAWTHVSWAISAVGLAVALPTLVVLSRSATRWRMTVALSGSLGLLLGSVLGPYGLGVWQLLLDIRSESAGQIVEWLSPFTPGLRARWLPVVFLTLALLASCATRVHKRSRQQQGTAERTRWALETLLLAISIAAMIAGLFAIRFLGVAALTLLPVLAAEASAATARWRLNPDQRPWVRTRLSAAYWRPILTSVVVLLLPVAIWTARDPGQPRPEADLVSDLPADCHLFSDPDAAGATLLLRPDVMVWIDMRTEVHGSAAYDDTRRRLSSGNDVALPPKTTCAILPTATKAVHVDGSKDPWMQVKPSAGNLTVWVPE